MSPPSDQRSESPQPSPGVFVRFMRRLAPQAGAGDESTLAYWREWILWALYLAGALAGPVIYLASVLAILRDSQYYLLILDTTALVWCWTALLLGRRLSPRLRSLVACLAAYLIGMSVLVNVGPVSGGMAWLFTFAVLAGILLGRRAAALAIGLNAVSLILLTWAIRSEYWVWLPSPGALQTNWPVAGVNFILLNTMVAITVAALLKGLENAIARESAARLALEKRTAQANQAQASLNAILRASPVGIGVVVDRVLTMANPRLCRITGYAEEELLGRSARVLYPDQAEYDFVGREKYRQIAEKGTGTVETRWVRKDGSIGHILLSSTPIADDDLKAGVTFTATDITQRKRMEEDLRARLDELAALNSLGRDVATTLSLEHASHAALTGILKALRPDLVMLFLRQGDGLKMQEAQPAEAALRLGEIPRHIVGRCLCGLAVSENRPIFSGDIHGDARCVMEECKLAGFSSFAALPLRSGEAVIGVLGLAANEPRDFSGQGEFLETLAAQLSVALANAHLFETLRQELAERRRTEQALKESQERFRALGEQSPLGISVLDGQGRCQYVNPAFAKMFGYALEEMPTGRDWFRLAFPDQEARREVVRQWVEDVRHHPAGDLRSRTYPVTCKDGSVKTILFRSVAIGQGGSFVLYEDISERLTAEAALRASERRYRQLFDGIDDIVFTHDLQGRIISINRAVQRILGFPPAELVGRAFGDFMLPQFRRLYFDEYLPGLIAQGKMNGVTKYLGKDGQIRYIEYRSLLTREEGSQPYVRGSARDVTPRIQAERELRLLEEQLFQSQKMEAVGVLAGGIAHDFNNVLQAIAGYVHLIQADRQTGDATRQRLDGVTRYIERAGGMIKRLMTMARRVDTRLEKVDLNREVRHMVGILEHTLPKMIAIRLDLEPDLDPISGDPGQIEQVLLNLAANAGQAMTAGGDLFFCTRNRELSPEEAKALPGLKPGGHVRLQVSDTGPGMDEETLSHIFEPFFTTKPLGEGTGLGLSTVYGIVANHGGLVSCQSRPGEGTTFTIHLPARTGEVAEAAPRPSVPTPVLSGNETILVVDDEPAIRESCREALASQGYSVLTAASGEEALELFGQAADDLGLVIMDLGMPGMGGFSALLAMLGLRPAIKILVATGYADETVQEQVSGRANVGIIRKPYRLAELLAQVRALLDQTEDAGTRVRAN